MLTRRDTIKGLAGLSAIIASGNAPAAVIKSIATRCGIMGIRRVAPPDHLIQEFLPSNPVFDGTSSGVFYPVSDRLRTHLLDSSKDVSLVVNINPTNNNPTGSDGGGIFYMGTKTTWYSESPIRLYNRDSMACKFLCFQNQSSSQASERYLYLNNSTTAFWDKDTSLTITFSGTDMFVYVNGVRVKIPDGKVTHTRENIDVGDYIRIPYNAGTNYFGKLYSIAFFDCALTPAEVMSNYEKDKARFGF